MNAPIRDDDVFGNLLSGVSEGVVSGLDVMRQGNQIRCFAFITDGGNEIQVTTDNHRLQTALEQASGNVDTISQHKPRVEVTYVTQNNQNYLQRVRFLDR